MVAVVTSIHIIVCIALVIVVLLQQGKGAEVGAVFGGSSQTVFGASGAGNVLTKTTAALAFAFFLTSGYLALNSTQRATGSIFGGGAPSSVMPQSAPKPRPAAAAPVPNAPKAPAGAPATH